MVVVEAEDRDHALAASADGAKTVIQASLAERSKDTPCEYGAVEVHELVSRKNMNA